MNPHHPALQQFFFLDGRTHWQIRQFDYVEVERQLDDDGLGFYRKRFLKTADGRDFSYWTEREIRFVSHFASVKTPQVARPKRVEYGGAAVKQVDTQDAGPSLDNWLKLRVSPAHRPDRIGPLFADHADIARLLCACLQALHGLHQDGIIHCDIKADNICLGYLGTPLTEDGLRLDYARLSLIDFSFSVWPDTRTWELTQALPIAPDAAAADYISPYFKAILREDQLVEEENQRLARKGKAGKPPQAWQRLNYSVDLFALGVMLRKLLDHLDAQRRDIVSENPLETFLYDLAADWQNRYAEGHVPGELPHLAEIAKIQERFAHVAEWERSGQFIPREAPRVAIPKPTPIVNPTPIPTPIFTPPRRQIPRKAIFASVILSFAAIAYYIIPPKPILATVAAVSESDEVKAERLYLNKDYSHALPLYRKLAEAGNGFAQFRVGSFYDYGYGVPMDNNEAAKWYERSANAGDAFGQANLAGAYGNGLGKPIDKKLAEEWDKKSRANGLKAKAEILANQGDPVAQDYLGHVLYEEKDFTSAAAWYAKSAEQGNAEAQCELGFQYLKGDGAG